MFFYEIDCLRNFRNSWTLSMTSRKIISDKYRPFQSGKNAILSRRICLKWLIFLTFSSKKSLMWHLMTLYFKNFSTFSHLNSVLTSNYQRPWHHLQRSVDEKALRRKVHISNLLKEVLKHFLSKLAQQVVYGDRLRDILHDKAKVIRNQRDAKLLPPF